MLRQLERRRFGLVFLFGVAAGVGGGCAATRLTTRPAVSPTATRPATTQPAAGRPAPRLTSILWHPTRGGVVQQRAWLVLRAKGQARAYDGCNRGSGTWERAADGIILLSVRRWTRRGCRGRDAADLGLDERGAFRWKGDRLEGRAPDGRPLVFQAAGAPFPASLGGTWQVAQVRTRDRRLRTALAQLHRLKAALILVIDPPSLGYAVSVACLRRPGRNCLEHAGIVNRRRERLVLHRLSSSYVFDPASRAAETLAEMVDGESRYLLVGDRLELSRDGSAVILRRKK